MAFTLLDWRAADNVVESKGSKKKLCHLAAERLKVKKDRSAGKRIRPLQYNIVSIFWGQNKLLIQGGADGRLRGDADMAAQEPTPLSLNHRPTSIALGKACSSCAKSFKFWWIYHDVRS